jgi:hypothetical protein
LPPSCRFPPQAGGTQQRFPLRSRGNLTEGVFKKCRAMSLLKGERAKGAGGFWHAKISRSLHQWNPRPCRGAQPCAIIGRASRVRCTKSNPRPCRGARPCAPTVSIPCAGAVLRDDPGPQGPPGPPGPKGDPFQSPAQGRSFVTKVPDKVLYVRVSFNPLRRGGPS